MSQSTNPSGTGPTAYDAVSYPAQPLPQAHPEHLATLATLFGMTPASPESCRVLELGCSDGGNLIPLAHALPGSTFIGVDRAPSAIVQADREASELGLTNIQFHCADLLDWTPPEGAFDYVIAHGLFSWVPEAVRLRILELCDERLAPMGVAFISYNALPGWHIRDMMRQMLLFHTQHFAAPAEKIAQARTLLNMLAVGQKTDDEYCVLLKKEAQRLLARSDHLLCHDDLSPDNQSYYFHDFMALAGRYGLQFLAEADVFEMQDRGLPASLAAALQPLSGTIEIKEQYLDFIKCRRFRQTLLCRQQARLNRAIRPELVRHFLIASPAQPKSASPDLASGVVEGFLGLRGANIQTNEPTAKAAMLELQAAWPRGLSFDDLLARARRRLGTPAAAVNGDESRRLGEIVLAAFCGGAIDLHVFQAPCAVVPGQRPILNPVTRMQLNHNRFIVTSLAHRGQRLDVPIVRQLFLLLDGTRDLDEVAAELGRLVDSGALPLPAGTARENLPVDVAATVAKAAMEGLLIG